MVGLEGSGKSTLIHQLRLLHHNGYFTEERRRERLAGIKHIVRESTQALAIGLRDNGVAQSEEAVAAREWVCAHASRNCPEPCQAFYEHAKRLWADDETKAFYRRHRHNQVRRKEMKSRREKAASVAIFRLLSSKKRRNWKKTGGGVKGHKCRMRKDYGETKEGRKEEEHLSAR